MRSAPVKLNGSVSSAALVEFMMTVASMPAPTNVTSARSKNLKYPVPMSNVPAPNWTVPPPAVRRSATAFSTTDFREPVNVVPALGDCAW
jgi:hypothetical protein